MKKKPRLKKPFRILLYFLIEILYTVLILLYMNYIHDQYSFTTVFDTELYSIIRYGAVFLIWVIGPMLNRYVLFLYVGAFLFVILGQTWYYRAFNSYCRINTALDLFGEVVGVKESAFEFIQREELMVIGMFVVITLIFILLYFLCQRRCFRLRWRIPYKLAFLCLLIPMNHHYQDYLAMTEDLKNNVDLFQMSNTDYYIYDVIPTTNQFVDRFGILPLLYRDGELYLQKEVMSAEDKEEIAQFLAGRPEKTENDYTGLFAGKNLFIIQAESFNRASLDEELTPNIYKMYRDGLRVRNFNTPALPGSTSDTEFMTNVSLIPNSEGHAVCYAFPENEYRTTLPKLFNDAGYWTAAYHNNYGKYYNRDVIFPTYGYQDFYDSNRIGVADGTTDLDVMEVLKWMYVENEKPYMIYWITYSGHQPYTLDSFGVSEESVARIKAKYPNLDDSFVSYIAKNMDLDQAIGNFMEEMEKAGKLDDVVFLFFGDHEVKNLNLWGDSIFYEQTGIKPMDEYRYTELYFYNSAMEEPMEYTKTATALDLLPTIANLWGLDYDPHTILGRDIFDPEYDGLFFSEWEYWKTDHYYYNFMDDEFEFLDDYDEEKARQEMDYAFRQKEISRKILKLDYFAAGKKD